MKVFASYSSDTVIAVYPDDHETKELVNCYTLFVDSIDDKFVPKSLWGQLKDENGSYLWDEDSGVLKPQKGYVIAGETKIKFKHYPWMWSIDEILKEKYKKLLEKNEKKNVYFQEFLNGDVRYEGLINLGKKFCQGEGILLHSVEKTVKEFTFKFEYTKSLPKISISVDKDAWTKVDSSCFSHRFKKETDQLYIKIDDTENILTAYSFYY
jgi:hypothetical protein